MLNQFMTSRGCSKTGIIFAQFLHQLKESMETPEEKAYIEQMQEEWSEFCVGLTLRSLQ